MQIEKSIVFAQTPTWLLSGKFNINTAWSLCTVLVLLTFGLVWLIILVI